MKISYAITVCNEFIEIQRLVNHLLKYKNPQDNIVILYDENNGDPEVENYLRSHSVNGEFSWHKGKFDKNFAEWKNKLNSLCNGDYIFNVDADEIPNEFLIKNLPLIIELNPEVDLYRVPRVNTVEDITEEHIKKWGWHINEHGWINFPDKQSRIYRNTPEIKWEGKVHETIKGFKLMGDLDPLLEYCIFHPKTIEKQEKQNKLYNEI